VGGTEFNDTLGEETLRVYRLAISERDWVVSVTFQEPYTAFLINFVVFPTIAAETGLEIPFSASYDVDAHRVTPLAGGRDCRRLGMGE